MRRQLVPIPQPPYGHMQTFESNNPFRHIHQMMMSMGSMNHDPFLNSMLGFGMLGIRDPMEDMLQFSDIHKHMRNTGAQGSYAFQSYVSSSKIGPDGKMTRQDYFQNNMGQNKAGTTISQKQQAYKNNQGVNRIAEERMLNDQGRKIVRQKIGDDVEETNHYYNIDEDEAEKFDQQWNEAQKRGKFIQGFRGNNVGITYGGTRQPALMLPQPIEQQQPTFQHPHIRRQRQTVLPQPKPVYLQRQPVNQQRQTVYQQPQQVYIHSQPISRQSQSQQTGRQMQSPSQYPIYQPQPATYNPRSYHTNTNPHISPK